MVVVVVSVNIQGSSHTKVSEQHHSISYHHKRTHIYFDRKDLALLLQAWRTVGRYQALSYSRQKLMSFTGHVPCSLNNLAARRPQVWPRDHLRQCLCTFLQLRLSYNTIQTVTTIPPKVHFWKVNPTGSTQQPT